jgi:hypothetical protein
MTIEEVENYNVRSVQTNNIRLEITTKDGKDVSVELTQSYVSEEGGIEEHETVIENEDEVKEKLTEDEFDELQDYIDSNY